jgi:outer membrane biosynthesis protein TonB
MKAIVVQEQDRSRAAIISFVFHAGLLAILFFYRFSAPEPIAENLPAIMLDMGGGGDDAALGSPDEGQGDDPAPQGDPEPASEEPIDEPDPEPSTPSTPPPASTPPPSTPTRADVPRNTPTTNDPDVAAVRKQQEETKRREQQEQDRIRREQDAERNRVAEAERQRQQAEADRKAREEADRQAKKNKFGGTFGSGTGSGSGNTGKPGNQGSPSGTGSNPFGKEPGSGGGTGGGDGSGAGGGIGGGLRGRNVLQRPRPDCEGTGTGKVIVEVVVDASGRVTTAKATQRGSTLVDSKSRSCAERTAKRFVFAPAQAASQSGTIQVNFGYSQGN